MKKDEQINLIHFILKIKDHNNFNIKPYQVCNLIFGLKECEIILSRLYTKACNQPLTKADENKIKRTRSRVQSLLDENLGIGYVVKFNTDPRGSIIQLWLPGMCESMEPLRIAY